MIQLLVGGVGGYFVATLRQRRGELLRVIDEASNLLHEFEDLGCDYWQRDGDDQNLRQLEWTIQSRAKRLGLALKDIKARRPDFNFVNELTRLRRAVTRDPFGSKERQAIPDRIEAIQEGASDLREILNRCRRPKWKFSP